MKWSKRDSDIGNNNIHYHVKSDNFNSPIEEEYIFIDLGQEIFTFNKEHKIDNNVIQGIPELKDINIYSDEEQKEQNNDILSNLSYPEDIKYVHKKYQRAKIKEQKKIKKTKKILRIILIVCFILLGLVVYEIIKWQKDNIDTQKQIDEINEEVKIEDINNNQQVVTDEEKNLPNDYFDFQNVDMISVDFDSLIKRNSDTVGWIKVEGTSINYPFVQTSNNDYYLNHSFNKKSNDAGWVYLDYRNNINNLSQNTIIYGHGRLNNTMFGSLKKVVKKNWYSNKSNQIVKISTPTQNSVWQVFSTYTIEPESYYITTNFSDNQSYLEFINKLKTRSIYNYNVDVTTNDHILTLSSCYNDQKRVVLHAKLISRVHR